MGLNGISIMPDSSARRRGPLMPRRPDCAVAREGAIRTRAAEVTTRRRTPSEATGCRPSPFGAFRVNAERLFVTRNISSLRGTFPRYAERFFVTRNASRRSGAFLRYAERLAAVRNV